MELLLYVCSTLSLVILFLYLYRRNDHSYWRKRNVPEVGNSLPILGNTASVTFFRKNMIDLLREFYENSPECSMVGFYDGSEPCLLLKDPELVRSVIAKDFSDFADNDLQLQDGEEPMLSNYAFFTSGLIWKSSRAKLAASFTSGKLRSMFLMVENVVDKLIQYTDRKIQENAGVLEVDAKSYFSTYTAELFASIGFGKSGNSFDSSDPYTFFSLSQLVIGNSWGNRLRMNLLFRYTRLMGYLNLSFFPSKFAKVFRELIAAEIQSRDRQSDFHNPKSFVQLMIDQELKTLDSHESIHSEVLAHMMSFFIDLYDTTSVAMVFIFYYLATNKTVQEKIRNEIDSALKDSDGKLTMDVLDKLVFTEQAIHESLRLQPAVGQFVRVCTTRHHLTGFDGLSCWIEPGTKLFISIDGLHKDPAFWSNPDTFDPAHFSKDLSSSRPKVSYLGFGEGPRMCPGKRLAMISMKMALCRLVPNYSWSLSSKTRLPFRLDTYLFLRSVTDGVWLRLRPLQY